MSEAARRAPGLDATHDPDRRCWVEGAEGHPDFPIQNLPLGVVSVGDAAPRGAIAIGDRVLDLAALAESGLVEGAARAAARAGAGETLNPLLALGAGPRTALRRRVSDLLSDPAARAAVTPMLHAAADCAPHLPARIGDYTDFYVGIHHATNVGRLFRPDAPLLPNYKHVPIGYHGRASSVRVSGTPVRRPLGQIKPPDADAPRRAPTRRLDYELELGVWIGPGNALGAPVPIGAAAAQIAGLTLLNDWSARDVQAWEYQPLGPFLAKNFLTSVSPWIVTAEALAPFRIAAAPRPAGDPAPLAYLDDPDDRARGGLAITLEVYLETERMRAAGAAPHRISRGDATAMYWTIAQMVTHHSSGGCDLRPGDLLGTGTLSGTTPDSVGSLLERSRGGAEPITLPSGERRAFLEDGDRVTMTARATAPGCASIGFGVCTGLVLPAVAG